VPISATSPALAIALPIPDAAPVTTAPLSFNSFRINPSRTLEEAGRFTDKGVKVALLFVLFHQQLCGPLANSLYSGPQNLDQVIS